MDIGRIGRYLASWRYGFHLSLSFAAVHTVLAVMDFHAAYLAGITFHAGIALMCKFLEFYEERHKIMEGYSRSLEELCLKRGRIIELYEKLYGQLQKEGNTNEKEKENGKEETGKDDDVAHVPVH